MSKYEFYNCTPHDIVLYEADGKTVKRTFPKRDFVLRLDQAAPNVAPFQNLGVPVVEPPAFSHHGAKDMLNANDDITSETLLIVSMVVGDFFANKDSQWWMFGPDTGPDGVVRDEKGQIIGTKRLVFYTAPMNTRLQCPLDGAELPFVSCCLSCGTLVSKACHLMKGTHLTVQGGELVRVADDAEPTPASPSKKAKTSE
jgi:hypothetical protein